MHKNLSDQIPFDHDFPHNHRDRQAGEKTKKGGVPSQVLALANAVLAYAQNIDDLDKILPAVRRICHKHVSRGVEAAHYTAVGECLLAAISDVLGDEVATRSVMTAWEEAFGTLAETFVAIEADLKMDLSQKAGFDGLVDMLISSKGEGDGTIGFVPVKHAVPPYCTGQFVTIAVKDGMTSMELVQRNNGELTVSLSRPNEQATVALMWSNVGDVLRVSMPCGSVE